MPDLSEFLATEARRREPSNQPPFEDLLRARRARDRRGRVAAGSLLVTAVAGAVLVPTLLDAQRPPTRAVVASPGQEATVTGALRPTGGPFGAGQTGLSGAIVFESAAGQRSTTTTRADGTFIITVKPGTYKVTGISAQYQDGRAECRAPDLVTVSNTGLAGVIVACPERTPATGAASHPVSTVTARITLPTKSLRSGQSLPARITVNNNLGADIHFTGCGPIFRVLLVGSNQHPTPSWLLCASPITIPMGETTYPVSIAATYSECSATKGQGMPACMPDGSMPGIPPGKYAVTTWVETDQVRVPDPVTVTVTP